MSNPSRRIIRLPEILSLLGGISKATFFRRYRYLEEFPIPVALPDGLIGYFSDEIDEYLNSLGRSDEVQRNVTPLTDLPQSAPRASGNPVGNSRTEDQATTPEAA